MLELTRMFEQYGFRLIVSETGYKGGLSRVYSDDIILCMVDEYTEGYATGYGSSFIRISFFGLLDCSKEVQDELFSRIINLHKNPAQIIHRTVRDSIVSNFLDNQSGCELWKLVEENEITTEFYYKGKDDIISAKALHVSFVANSSSRLGFSRLVEISIENLILSFAQCSDMLLDLSALNTFELGATSKTKPTQYIASKLYTVIDNLGQRIVSTGMDLVERRGIGITQSYQLKLERGLLGIAQKV